MKDPPDPVGTNLFKNYVSNSPAGTFPRDTSTYQGLYCMTADGGYLSGKFARQTNGVARDVLISGLDQWKANANSAKPVPTNRLALYGGEDFQKGGIKLEVAYRDLPRGEVERPGDSRFPNPYNMGWYDLTPAEAKIFLTNSQEKTAIPDGVFRKLAHQRLKDAVRGQMGDWKEGDVKNGQLLTQLTAEKGSKKFYQLSGNAKLAAGDLTFEPTFHGTYTYDTAEGEFTDFRLIAAGQRSGKGGANGRATDLGPAPIGIGFKLFTP